MPRPIGAPREWGTGALRIEGVPDALELDDVVLGAVTMDDEVRAGETPRLIQFQVVLDGLEVVKVLTRKVEDVAVRKLKEVVRTFVFVLGDLKRALSAKLSAHDEAPALECGAIVRGGLKAKKGRTAPIEEE